MFTKERSKFLLNAFTYTSCSPLALRKSQEMLSGTKYTNLMDLRQIESIM